MAFRRLQIFLRAAFLLQAYHMPACFHIIILSLHFTGYRRNDMSSFDELDEVFFAAFAPPEPFAVELMEWPP